MTSPLDLDLVRRLPTTWAGAHYVRRQTEQLGLNPETGVALWLGAVAAREKAERVVQHPKWSEVPLSEFADVLTKRIFGFDAFGVARIYYDDDRSQLMRWEPDGSHRAVKIKGETLTPRAHLHELRATNSYRIRMLERGSGQLGIELEIDPVSQSLWNKVLSGSRRGASMLGVPIVERVDYPAAYLDHDVRLSDDAVVEIRRVGQVSGDENRDFDVIEYFMSLWRDGKLPLDTEEDVRRFVVALALPLIRYLAVGLLGVVWVLGPPGAGKDFMAELPPSIWYAALEAPTSKAKFDLDNGKDELELKRNLSQAGGAVYARAKEAAKRGEHFVTALIRLGGTDEIAVRAMRENETEIDNTYTIVADSAEDIPDRREVRRRTIEVRARRLEEDALGELRTEILSHAPAIVSALKRLIEQKDRDYWTHQRNTNGRPVGQVAVARLLGCDLDTVVGRDLSDLWDGLAYWAASRKALTEAADTRKRLRAEKQTPKDLRDAIKKGAVLDAYRLTVVLDALKDRLCPHRVFFDPFRGAAGIATLIKREADYDTIARKVDEYLPVEHGGRWYALRLVRDDRYVIWMPEAAYRAALGLKPIKREADERDDGDRGSDHDVDGIDAEKLNAIAASIAPHIPAVQP